MSRPLGHATVVLFLFLKCVELYPRAFVESLLLTRMFCPRFPWIGTFSSLRSQRESIALETFFLVTDFHSPYHFPREVISMENELFKYCLAWFFFHEPGPLPSGWRHLLNHDTNPRDHIHISCKLRGRCILVNGCT